MAKKILGGLFAIWGAAILINHFFIEKPPAAPVNSAYQGGSTAALFLAALFIFVGLATVFKKEEAKK